MSRPCPVASPTAPARGPNSEFRTPSGPAGPAHYRIGIARAFALGLTIIAFLSGCGLLRSPTQLVSVLKPAAPAADPISLQVQLQRLADDYSAQAASAIDEAVRRVGTEAARRQGLQWKLSIATAAISIASGPQPKANLLDMVSLATLNRNAVEQLATNSLFGDALLPWVEVSRRLETNSWNLAASRLPSQQVEELRDGINQWQQSNPAPASLFAARPQEFATLVKSSQRKENEISSVFSLVGLDPTAGLDPAVREVTLTRLFAERALYVAQRMPLLVRWQTEALFDRIEEKPGLQLALTNTTRIAESADRLSRAAETASTVAAQLPDRVSAERKALLAALEQQEGRLRELAAEVTRTLDAGQKMSGTLSITITNFDALMKRFGVGEPDTGPPADTNSPPFNILDYARTATQIAEMARELNVLITSANQSVPRLEALSQQATAASERIVERGFRLGLLLIVILLGGSVLAGLTYRLLARRFFGPSAPPAPPGG